MQRLIIACLRIRILIVAVATVLLAGGLWQIRQMPLDAVPEFSPVTLQVRTEALGLSASEVESLITVPLEADLLIGVPWLKSIDSESVAGVSSIDLLFEPGTDLMRARQMVNERMTQARALPNVSSPPTLLLPVATANRIMNIGMTSKTVPLIDMSVEAQWTVLPRISGVPGVANVTIWGQRNRQVQVQVDPARLHEKGVTLDQVVKTAGEAVWASPLTYLNSSTPGTGGFIDTPNQRLNIRHVFPVNAVGDFANIPVTGTQLALREVADVVEGHQPLIGDAVFRDGPGLLLVIEKYPGFNTVEVTQAVEAAIEELRPGLTGIDIDTTMFRPASFIGRATDNVSKAALIAAILAAVALAFMLGNWRSTVAAGFAIALSMTAAGFVFYICGFGLNMMVLAGLLLAIAAVVDDAVVDARKIQMRLRDPTGDTTRPLWRMIAGASAEARGPMLYATLILVIAVSPLLFMQGLSAAFLQPLAWAYITAVVASMVVATTVTPAFVMLLRPSRAGSAAGTSVLGGWLQRRYAKFAAQTMKSWIPGYVLAAGALLLLFLVWAQQERTLIPSFNETDLFVEVQAPAGTSLPAMEQTCERLIHELSGVPGVRTAVAQIGRAVLSREVANVDAATIWISLDPAADNASTVAGVRRVVDAAPELNGSVQTFLSKKIRESLTGEDEAISVRIYGQDLGILRSKADEIKQTLSKIEGIKDPEVEAQSLQQAIDVEVDLEKARGYGLKPGDVRRAASALIGGITVGTLFRDQKVFDVVVWGSPDIRRNLDDVRNLLVDTESGTQVRLANVARVNEVETPSVIHRQGASRRIDVEAEVSGRSLAAVTQEVRQRIKEGAYPFEFHAEVRGEFVERQAEFRSLYGYIFAACVLILLLLQATFSSWRLSLLVIAASAVAILGSLIVNYLTSGVLVLGSFLGLMAIAGLSIRNGLRLVHRFQAIEQQRLQAADDVLSQGAGEELPATLATAVTLAAVLLPFAYMGEVPGLEILHPAAVVMLGGLVTSTLVSAFILPALYVRLRTKLPVAELSVTQEVA